MRKESTDVRLARIEEHITGLRKEIHTYHTKIVDPALKKVDGHDKAITGMKRDRWWIGTIMTTIGTLVGFKIGKAG